MENRLKRHERERDAQGLKTQTALVKSVRTVLVKCWRQKPNTKCWKSVVSMRKCRISAYTARFRGWQGRRGPGKWKWGVRDVRTR